MWGLQSKMWGNIAVYLQYVNPTEPHPSQEIIGGGRN